MSRVLCAIVLGAALLGAAPASRVAADERTDELARLINQARAERGLSQLPRNAQLDQAAEAHSRDMVANAFLDHEGSDGSKPPERARRFGYHSDAPTDAWLVVEVISAISGEPVGPLNWWLNESPDVHGKALTDGRWQEMGVGYAAGGEYGNYWTVLFGRPIGDAATPSLTVSPVTVASGADVDVRWSGIPTPSDRDWIGLYDTAQPAGRYLAWVYVSCAQAPLQPRSNGWCWLRVPADLPSGSYELGLHADNGMQRLATSQQVAVTRSEVAAVPEPYWR